MKRIALLPATLIAVACGGAPKPRSAPALPYAPAAGALQLPAPGVPATPLTAGAPFAEVEAVLVPQADPAKGAAYQVTRIFRIVEGFLMEEGGEVVASCPSPGSDVCSYRIGREEVLPLALTVHESKRPHLFRAGTASSLELSVPPGGWERACGCRKTAASVQARLLGAFVSQSVAAGPVLHISGPPCDGASDRMWMRKCGVPDLPSTIRVRLSWDRGLPEPETARR